jgi:hypothetical protein
MGSARSVYVTDLLSRSWVGKWKISVLPVVITVEGLAPAVVLPLINCKLHVRLHPNHCPAHACLQR